MYIKQANLNTVKKYLLSLIFIGIAIISWSQQTRIEWISPTPVDTAYSVHDDELTIKLNIINALKGTKPYIEINGNPPNSKADPVPLSGSRYFEQTVYIPDNSLQSIVLTLKDGGGRTYHRSAPLIVSRGTEPPPILYLLAFGPKPGNMEYSDNDAIDLERAFSRQACGTSGIYADVVSDKFILEEADANKMLIGMENMIALNTIKPNDVVILFMSSHGGRKNGEFYIQGNDFDSRSERIAEKTSVSSSELFEVFDPVHAKKVFIIDACKSGESPKDSLIFKSDKNQLTGYLIIASSDFNADSYWYHKGENGVFTEILLRGLKREANKATPQDDIITTDEIISYLKEEVPILCHKVDSTKKVQRPQIVMNELGNLPLFKYDKFCAPVIGGEEIFYEAVKLPQGTVTIGSSKDGKERLLRGEDEQQRDVTIDTPTAIGKYEVTNVEYCEFLNDSETNLNNLHKWINLKSSQCKIKREGTEFTTKHFYKPVVMVSWEGAVKFSQWLSDKDCIYDYDLPTADEWEYAARGGPGKPYKIYPPYNNFDEFNQSKKIRDVGTYTPNSLGIHDMNTNVSEWCKNKYQGKGEKAKEVRGGNFNLPKPKNFCRTAKRHYLDYDVMKEDLGFRLIRTPKKDKDCE